MLIKCNSTDKYYQQDKNCIELKTQTCKASFATEVKQDKSKGAASCLMSSMGWSSKSLKSPSRRGCLQKASAESKNRAQVENEYGYCGSDRNYIRALLRTAKAALGEAVIFYTTDPPSLAEAGSLPGDELYT